MVKIKGANQMLKINHTLRIQHRLMATICGNQIDEAHELQTADQDQIFEEQNNNEHDENQIENQANEYDDTIDNELVHNLEILLLDPEPYENNEAEDIEINDANDAQESIKNENQSSEANGEDQRSESE